MTTATINEDEFYGDAGKSVEQIMHEVEEFGRSLAVGDPGVAHETKPAGYGTLLETYEWRPFQGQAGTAPYVRAWCLEDSRWMILTLKVDPRYGTNIKHGVQYRGLPVSAWACDGCAQWVVR